MSGPNHDAGHEDQVNEAIAAYLEAAERGEPPGREEWLARHADLAGDLASFFADRDAAEQLIASLLPGAAPSLSGQTVLEGGNTAARPIAARTLGQYEILEELGRGGMGVVYKALQVGLGRIVALKMILCADHAGERERQRFQSEAEVIARLQHPHIVQIFEVGEHEGMPYFSMEYCPDGSLADRLAGTPVAPGEAARLVQTLARAMEAAHRVGVVHRDLKPANVEVDPIV
jgi:serine/threonine-protein kinase